MTGQDPANIALLALNAPLRAINHMSNICTAIYNLTTLTYIELEHAQSTQHKLGVVDRRG